MSGIAPRGPGSNLQAKNPFETLGNLNSLFGGGASATNPFGSSNASASPFGTAFGTTSPIQATQPSAGGAAFGISANPFASASDTNNPFASAPSTGDRGFAAPNPFGATPPNPSPQQPATGLFGGVAPAAAPPINPFGSASSTTNLFGAQATPPSTNLFGGLTTSSGGTNLFGGQAASVSNTLLAKPAESATPAAAPVTSTGGTGLFGLPAPSPQTSSPPLFGGLTQPQQSASVESPLNVAPTSSGAGSLFGTSKNSLFSFGTKTSPAPEASADTPSKAEVRELTETTNELTKSIWEMSLAEVEGLKSSERTMRDPNNCKVVYAQQVWKAGQVPELPRSAASAS